MSKGRGTMIAVRNIRGDAKDGSFKSESDVHNAVDEAINLIEEHRASIVDAFNRSDSCAHEFKPPLFSVRKMMFDFVTFYERSCKLCGIKEVEAEGEKGEKPERGSNTKKQKIQKNSKEMWK